MDFNRDDTAVVFIAPELDSPTFAQAILTTDVLLALLPATREGEKHE